jgi:hypothetical protein
MVRTRRLILAALAAITLALGACSTPSAPPTRDPRDPEVWRPTTPAVYPLPR